MPHDDRIDNKRILVSSCAAVDAQNSEKEVLAMSIVSHARPARARGGRIRRRGRAARRLPLGARRRPEPAARAEPTPPPPAPLLSGDGATVLRLASRCGAGSGSCASSSTSSSPGPETTVVDVGVTDAPFGDGLERQLLRGALPVAGADHGGRAHRARPLRRRVPDGDGRAGRRARAAVRRRRSSTSASRTP